MNTHDLHPTAKLAEFAEGSLDTQARAAVASHLLGCNSCRIEVRRWERLVGAFHSLPAVAVPAGLSDRIAFAVAREAVRRRQAASWLSRAAAALSWGYATGMAFFSAALLGLIFVPTWRDGAAHGVALVSSEALRLGVAVLDVTAGLWGGLRDFAGDLLKQADWLAAVGRALSAALSQPEVQIVLLVGASATLLLFLALIAGGHRRKGAGLEVPHAGFLVA
jgi:hypothetical protein